MTGPASSMSGRSGLGVCDREIVEPETRRDCVRTGLAEVLPTADLAEALLARLATLVVEPERTRGAAVEIDSLVGAREIDSATFRARAFISSLILERDSARESAEDALVGAATDAASSMIAGTTGSFARGSASKFSI